VVERHDVVVVGARCAGAPLATFLARAGLSVALLDRATFPSDTPSTHVFQASGVSVLGRLGVVDRLRATGAPWLAMAEFRIGDMHERVQWPTLPDDPGPGLCVRRPVLDTILVENAEAAGAAVHTGVRVTGTIEDNGRVTGVGATTAFGHAAGKGNGELRFEAPLVVGADGRRSTVARLVGARTYNVSPNERFGFWAYYEGATWSGPATVFLLRWDDEFVIACPADGGLYMVSVLLSLEGLRSFCADVERSYDNHVARCDLLGGILAGARRVDRPRGMASFSGFFRESAGPGWALVGDAGHFKDPSPGQGISDALRQSERLAEVIVAAGGRPVETDAALAEWWRWRDRDAAQMHWFAADLGGAGPVPVVFTEILRGLAREPDGLSRAVDVFNHRVAPRELLTPRRLASAATRAVAGGCSPRAVLREVRDVATREVQRRWRDRRPRFADEDPVPETDPAAVD
jgi:2-polyprenyl-6-methoxyphenol hydroxylase-like FAD-dependent oxidoreductase